MRKKVLSVVLLLCMVLTLLPSALALETMGAAVDAVPLVGSEPVEEGTAERPFTTVDAYNRAVKDNKFDGRDIYLSISGQEFGEGAFALHNVQKRTNPPRLHLTLTGCTFTGNTAGDKTNPSFMYLSNCQSLVLDGCTFNTGEGGLKYGINWNLIQIKDADVDIRNCTFSGIYEKNAVKLNQRNGADDTASDVNVDGEFAASIRSAAIINCEFSGTNAILQLGSQGKGKDGAAAPSTGAFPVTVTAGKSGAVVELAYRMTDKTPSEQVRLEPYQNGSKAADGSFGVARPVRIGDNYYSSLGAAIDGAGAGAVILLEQDIIESIMIPAGRSLTIDGQGHTLFGTVQCTAESDDPAAVTRLTLKNLTLDGTREGKTAVNFAVLSQNQGAEKQMALELTMEGCTVQNYLQQGLYLTNAKTLTITGGTFRSCGGINYAVDLNLVAVQDAVITIRDTLFEGMCGFTAPIKAAARGSDDGTGATDIQGPRASIRSLTIEGCTFNQSIGWDVVLGVTTKEGTGANQTGSFPVRIAGSKSDKSAELELRLAYKSSAGETITPPIGATVIGDGKSDPVVDGKVTGVAVVDGTDGYTPVTNPACGQKLTANIQTSNGVIGSYPVNPDARYKWYYQSSPDTILGTEPVYTVTSDNRGRIICVEVSVEGYEGSAVWTASGPVGDYIIVASAGSGGTISPSGTVSADAGGSKTFAISADSGYTISDVVVDGVSKGSISSYTFEKVDRNHTISATFSYVGVFIPTYAVAVEKSVGGSVKVNATRAGKGDIVTVTVIPDGGYELDWLTVSDEDGDTLKLTDKGGGKYTFSMPYGKVTVSAVFVRERLYFRDVPTGAYYYDAVQWAVDEEITSGTSATTFAPDVVCTRAQIVTFLWRASGSPAPSSLVNPFNDVHIGSYYYDAVLWAVEKGITSGTGARTFSPDLACTRAQVATFLWRAEGEPRVLSWNPFTDVAWNAYYADAVLWAARSGVTNGTSATTFAPDLACTRAQIVTFLYRAMA